uniref:Uncharacterized protein n=1 Tax=viral metagenome TaxID=1070528 RepID=A0A6C0HR62_9ZZZZ
MGVLNVRRCKTPFFGKMCKMIFIKISYPINCFIKPVTKFVSVFTLK